MAGLAPRLFGLGRWVVAPLIVSIADCLYVKSSSPGLTWLDPVIHVFLVFIQ